MIKRRGLSLRIFIFVFMLITFVSAVSLGVLYVMLPGYYYYQKNNSLKKNADTLAVKLSVASTGEERETLITGFAKNNNSSVVCYDEEGVFIPELSSPFLLINEMGKEPINIRYFKSKVEDGETGAIQGITIETGVVKQDVAEDLKNDRAVSEVYVATAETDSTMLSVTSAYKTAGTATDTAFISSSAGDFWIRGDNASAVIVKNLDSGTIGQMIVSSTLQPIDEAKAVLISLIPYLLIFDFIIAWLASYLFAKQLTKPILRISDAAAMMKEMKPEVLSNVRSADELGQLSQNLDSLYLSLCENIDSLKIEMNKTSALEQSKTEFMRAAGHELKTPIAALNGIIEGMIDNVGVYKNHNKYLNESKTLLDKLAGLVNEILVSTGRDYSDWPAELEYVNIRELMDEAIGIHEHLAEIKKLIIIRNDYDLTVQTDAHLLLNTFSNLISNAVKYTPTKGKVVISLKEDVKGHILSIENECPHIDESVLPKLFEPFFTLNFSRNKLESGTGLGLYIVKRNLEKSRLPMEIENTETGLKISIMFEETAGN